MTKKVLLLTALVAKFAILGLTTFQDANGRIIQDGNTFEGPSPECSPGEDCWESE